MSRPTDFFLGITDLFSVILPGSVLEFLVLLIEKQHGWDFLGLRTLSANEGYVAFFIGAWLLGHVTDMIGAFAVDLLYDLLYAHWKRSFPLSFTAWLAATPGRLLEQTRQILRGVLVARCPHVDTPGDALLARADTLAGKDRPGGFNLYKWSRTWTMIQSAPALNEIERLQANSKFFRGMVMVALIAATTSFVMACPFRARGAVLCLLFAGASFIRYCELRWKAVQQTYGVFVALRTMNRSQQVDAESHAAEPSEG